MKQAIALIAAVLIALELGRRLLGEAALLPVVYGAVAVMALMISATFLWLWAERATPLALGMVFSWAGTALFVGWWWASTLGGQPHGPAQPAGGAVIQAMYLVGATLHFAVIHRSFGYHGAGFLWPVVLALGLSGLAAWFL